MKSFMKKIKTVITVKSTKEHIFINSSSNYLNDNSINNALIVLTASLYTWILPIILLKSLLVILY